MAMDDMVIPTIINHNPGAVTESPTTKPRSKTVGKKQLDLVTVHDNWQWIKQKRATNDGPPAGLKTAMPHVTIKML